MAAVLCEVSDGLASFEATAKVISLSGRPEFIPVDRGMISHDNGHSYLSVHLIYVDRDKRAALVSLPVEADSGAHRIWVSLDRAKLLQEEAAA